MKRTTSVFAGMLAVLLVAAACGSDGDEDDPTVREDEGLTITEDPGADPDDPDFLAIYVPEDLALPVERLVKRFKDADPGILFQVTTGSRERLQAQLDGGAAPGLYIDTPEELEQLDADTGEIVTLGENPVRIVVARDNPRNVPGLEAFAAGDWTSGLCISEVLCGELGRQVLAAAGVEPAPDRVADNGRELVNAVVNGDVDAVLAMRSDSRMRFFDTEFVPMPPEYAVEIEYAMLPIRSGGAADQFMEFIDSPQGDRSLQIVGLRSLAL